MSSPNGITVLIMSIACGIVLLGWVAVVALLVVFLNRRVARIEAASPTPPGGSENDLLFYALSIFFWPAALVCAVHFMKDAKTARMARTCGVLGLVHVSAIVIATCAGMIAVAAYLPEWLR
ncbi:MAG: hypothetical protein U0359_27665 [Byssovorax sp.]